jgi:hypothetical protein
MNRSSGFFLKSLFFGNYFYGFCAVGLTIEATLQQKLPFNDLFYLVSIFAITVWYYTLFYSSEPVEDFTNQRTIWYSKNKQLVISSQWSMFLIISVSVFIFTQAYFNRIMASSAEEIFLFLLFPGVALLYYGVLYRFKKFSLRNIGWMKPFVIGFVWAGLVTVYPIVYYFIVNNSPFEFTWVGLFLFFKNFIFVTVLAIMFDVKDYATDSNQRLKTYVVEHGLRKTIFYILIPLSIAGLGSFLLYGFTRNFSAGRILLNTVPFLMMITVAYYLHRRQSIFYYLVLIDGLMLVKAICGSIAVSFF